VVNLPSPASCKDGQLKLIADALITVAKIEEQEAKILVIGSAAQDGESGFAYQIANEYLKESAKKVSFDLYDPNETRVSTNEMHYYRDTFKYSDDVKYDCIIDDAYVIGEATEDSNRMLLDPTCNMFNSSKYFSYKFLNDFAYFTSWKGMIYAQVGETNVKERRFVSHSRNFEFIANPYLGLCPICLEIGKNVPNISKRICEMIMYYHYRDCRKAAKGGRNYREDLFRTQCCNTVEGAQTYLPFTIKSTTVTPCRFHEQQSTVFYTSQVKLARDFFGEIKESKLVEIEPHQITVASQHRVIIRASDVNLAVIYARKGFRVNLVVNNYSILINFKRGEIELTYGKLNRCIISDRNLINNLNNLIQMTNKELGDGILNKPSDMFV